MNKERNVPAEGVAGRFEALQESIENGEFSRRHFLKAAGSVIALTAAQGISALDMLADREAEQALRAGDVCERHDIRCYLREANLLDVPAATTQDATVPPTTSTTIATTTTTSTTTVPPTTTPPPPPPPKTQEQNITQSSEQLWRAMPYEEFIGNYQLFISKLPDLHALHSMFRSPVYDFVPEQLAHIELLNQSVELTPEEYHNFQFDMSYANLIQGAEGFDPRMVIWHWTAEHYNNPAHLVDSWGGRASSHFYVHNDSIAYQLLRDLTRRTGHANKGLNHIAYGIEIYTGQYDDVHSPLFSYTPETTKAGLYTAMKLLRGANLPVHEGTFMGHYAADLIVRNPYYNPYDGTFHQIAGADKPAHIRKQDPPQEMITMLLAKLQKLDTELGSRESG